MRQNKSQVNAYNSYNLGRLEKLKNNKIYQAKDELSKFIGYLYFDKRNDWINSLEPSSHFFEWKKHLINKILIEEKFVNSKFLHTKELENSRQKEESEYIITLQNQGFKISIGKIILTRNKEPNKILITNYSKIPHSGYIGEEINFNFYTTAQLNNFFINFINKTRLENFSDVCKKNIFVDYIQDFSKRISENNIINNLEDIKHLINKEYLYSLLNPEQKKIISPGNLYIQGETEKTYLNKSIKIFLWDNQLTSQTDDLFQLIFDFNKKEKDLYLYDYTNKAKSSQKIYGINQLENLISKIMKSVQ
jgi:hypothetical protein